MRNTDFRSGDIVIYVGKETKLNEIEELVPPCTFEYLKRRSKEL